MERESEEEADERREAAIASSASLRPDFKLENGITHAQISKFQELHKRRLQIKAKSRVNNRPKGLVDGKGKSHRKGYEAAKHADEGASQAAENSNCASISSNEARSVMSQGEQIIARNIVAKKRQKLHWGLDTKERWERKSNM